MVPRKIRRYKRATDRILKSLIDEESKYGKLLNEFAKTGEVSTREKKIRQEKVRLARQRLSDVRSITPPTGTTRIHLLLVDAMSLGLEARELELEGQLFKASAAYQVASESLSNFSDLFNSLMKNIQNL